MTGTAFCGNSPVDPSLLSLVQNEVSQLSSNLDDFVCQFKEQKDKLESQLLEVKHSLEKLPELTQKVDKMEHDVETLKQQMAYLSTSSVKSEGRSKLPTFFGALDRNEYFTGRKKEMENLEKAFEDATATPDVPGVAGRKAKVLGICGLGGCGKSSLAFEYAWRNMERYPGGIFVVNGESDDLMRASLQGFHGEFIDISHSDQQKEAKSFEQLLSETLSWLGNLRDKWLLLVDNMDQKELSSCARTVFLGQWRRKTSGDILVTSRRRSQALCEELELPPENCFKLDVFSVHESVEFLKKRIGLPSSGNDLDNGAKEQLAQELGGLPLALEQAAAYIKSLKCTFQSYLLQYRSQKSILLNAKSAKPRTEVYSEARLAVQTTWLLNFSYIETGEKDQELGKAAAFFMKIAAFLSPDGIPIEILNIGAPEVEHDDLKRRLKMHLGADQIVELLVRFSLFKRKSGDTISIHRLVQETLRDRCDAERETDDVLSSAIRIMHQTFLNCVGGADFLRDLYDRLASRARGSESRMEQFCQLFFTCAEVPFETGRWKKLSVNAFHLACNLFKDSSLKPCFICEESARLFCEAAFYCYSLRMESQGHSLQQIVLEILCAAKEPIRYYKDNDLLKVTRILRPFTDSALLSMALVDSNGEKVSEATGVSGDTNGTEELLETIKAMEPRATEAFIRGDFQTSVDIYSDIVKTSNFNVFPGHIEVSHPRLVPLGEILCRRGIAHVKLENFETAVDDFNASTCVDIQYFHGYYWKAYALCKLVQSGRTEFISRAQAAAAMLHFKFADSKSDDIQKLQKKFPGLLDRIEHKFVSKVSELKELERLTEVRNDFSNGSLTIILADGQYNLNKLTLLGGRYYFVCPPGSTARLTCIKGLYLSRGFFLFENVKFVNPYALLPAVANAMSLEEDVDELIKLSATAKNFDTLTLGRTHFAVTEASGGTEQDLAAFVEANDVRSLVINHCEILSPPCTGIAIKFTESSHELRSVSVRSSKITCCSRNGLQLQGDAQSCHISIHGNDLVHNLYGIVIDSLSRIHLEKNYIFSNTLSGVVAIRVFEMRLLRNSLVHNGKHGILLNKANAILKENVISNNRGWGTVCSCESNLRCEENVLENNLSGGIRTMLNGKGTVSVQKCELRENSGPAVFPADEDELCGMELEWKQLLAASSEVPVPLYIRCFLEDTSPKCESIMEFKSPLLRGNRVSHVSKNRFDIEMNFCSACCKDLQLNGTLIECPSCHIARYCKQQCFDMAKAVHHPVCKSILEANMECVSYDNVFTLGNESPPVQDVRNRAGISLCVIVTLTSTQPSGPQSVTSDLNTLFPFHGCLLTCPQRSHCGIVESAIIHHFIAKHGCHLPDHMTDIKAACILANFDPESRIITVYKHRIFPLEKVPDAFSWVDRTLHVLEQCVAGLHKAPRNYGEGLKKRESRKRKQRFR